MTKLVAPFPKANASVPGVVATVLATIGLYTFSAPGIYKIAAMGTNLMQRMSTVTTVTGDYLAASDQELIKVNATFDVLNWVRALDSSDDGYINIVPIEIFEIPGQDPSQYGALP
jgi:hypothetical protein